MIFKILFKKLKLRHSWWFEAFIYGSAYFFMIMIIFLFYKIVTRSGDIFSYFWYSALIGFVMALVHLIKTEVFKFLK